MTDLTEQWKKGELPKGWYYVQLQEGVYVDNVKSIIMDYYTEFCDFMKHPYLIEKVLATVPSYEEWQLMQDDNKRLKHDVGNLGYKIKNQRHEIDNRLKEIEKLKELLKWCRDELFEVYSNEIPHHEDAPIIKKLDEVLK
ncbi:MAG: hypothetical protein IJI42_02730 [Methanobrevibacter sp.]|nr:hypothetical protein [Methanobrevibacter sp.]